MGQEPLVDFVHFELFPNYIFFVCVYVHRPLGVCGGQRKGQLWGVDSFLLPCGFRGFELRLSGLAASAFTH